MVKKEQDVLARAYATLSSLRKNIEQMTSDPPEIFVQEFHNVLTTLEGIGKDVSEFRIPDSKIAPRVTVIRTLTFADSPKSRADYSEEKYVDKSFILMRLDAILGYFEILTSEKPRRIGFSAPDNQ